MRLPALVVAVDCASGQLTLLDVPARLREHFRKGLPRDRRYHGGCVCLTVRKEAQPPRHAGIKEEYLMALNLEAHYF
jgi:hypothetical protein